MSHFRILIRETTVKEFELDLEAVSRSEAKRVATLIAAHNPKKYHGEGHQTSIVTTATPDLCTLELLDAPSPFTKAQS